MKHIFFNKKHQKKLNASEQLLGRLIAASQYDINTPSKAFADQLLQELTKKVFAQRQQQQEAIPQVLHKSNISKNI